MSRSPAPPVAPNELLGRWALRRRIADHRTGERGRVRGELDLEQVGHDVRWFEQGTLSWNGREVEVYRELWIVAAADGWQVRFADRRPFHPWLPGRPLIHPCCADTYRGLLAVDANRAGLRILWDVSGPGKQQRLFTRCRRLLRPSGGAIPGRATVSAGEPADAIAGVLIDP